MMGYSYPYSIKMTCFVLLIFVGSTASQKTKCPFQYLYDFGDGTTDIGNSIKILPSGPSLPAAHLPYGTTFPGSPTGRWSDGLVDVDYAAAAVSVPIAPYLSQNATTTDGVIFSVARSPVLNHTFFTSRGTTIPPSTVSISGQLLWFKQYLKSICSTSTDCANSRLRNSVILLDFIEGNDIGYPLSQGKSIQRVESYVPFVTRAIVGAIEELVSMGAKRILVSGNAPLGCYPYILTALPSNDPGSYDDLGCLKSVNNLIVSKNNHLQQAVLNLSIKYFTNATILYVPYYEAVRTVMREASIITGHGKTLLKACCGIGGRYNYDNKRFCGSAGVPVCPNPTEYIYWDGLHFTQEAYNRILQILVPPALIALKCIPF